MWRRPVTDRGRSERVTRYPEAEGATTFRCSRGAVAFTNPGTKSLPTSSKVLELYRKRSGRHELRAKARILTAGAFSIERLEGSRFGRANAYWVLNSIRDTNRDGCVTPAFCTPSPYAFQSHFSGPYSPTFNGMCSPAVMPMPASSG
jgi:hypothetical protein